MQRLLFILALMVSFVATASTAFAANEKKTDRLTATLVSDTTHVTPGSTFRVGVRFQMKPHWHIYWHSPGTTGLPTKIKFKSAEGITFGPLQWPEPKYFKTTPEIWGYGYEKDVVLFVDAQAPKTLDPKKPVTVTAKTSWLVCAEACVRGRATLNVSLPVGPKAPSTAAPVIQAAASKVPSRKIPDNLVITPTFSPEKIAAGETFTLRMSVKHRDKTPLTSGPFTPGASKGIVIEEAKVLTTGDGVPEGGFLITIRGIAGKKGKTIGGIIRVGKAPFSLLEVSYPLPRKQVASPSTSGAKANGQASAADKTTAAVTANQTPPDPKKVIHSEEQAEASFWLMLLFAFLGGLILNIMPCVLPVLSIKIFSLLEQSGDEPKTIRNHGLTYTGGVLFSFAVLAIPFMLAPRAWGFQMQHPVYLATLSVIVFAFAMSLFGVFEVTLPGSNAMNTAVAKRHGYSSSFVYGIFAVLLGTPCTAPLLAPALVFFLNREPLEIFIGLQAVGLGLAAPFLLLGFFPGWSKHLPKPGAWMETFKTLMGFVLIGTTVWLMSSMPKQLSPSAFMNFIAFIAVVGLCCWIYGHWGSAIRETRTRWLAILFALGIGTGGGMLFLGLEKPEVAHVKAGSSGGAIDRPAVVKNDIQWRDFATDDVRALAKAGYTVFIDFTADWCVTCKGYLKTVIDTETIRSRMVQDHIVPVEADFTAEDPVIDAWVKALGRPGVPVYLVIPAGSPDTPILLPQHLTTSSLLGAFDRAGPSKARLKVAN